MKHVIIVGGGVIGLFCAVRLRKGGASVTLLEAEREHAAVSGPAASAAAAGMLSMLDPERSPHAAVTRQSFDLWREWREGAEWADGVRFSGGVFVASDDAHLARLTESAGRHGSAAESLTARQFRKRTGFDAAPAAALFVGDEGVADPLRVLSGLAMQARAHGVVIQYQADVASVTADAAVLHDGRTVEGDRVLLAPGVWATETLMEAAPALQLVRPAKGHMAAVGLTHRLEPNLHAPGFYLAQRREDVVLGSTMESDRYDRAVKQDRIDALLAAADRVLPGEVAATESAWAGVRPMSPDGWPMIGPSGDVLVAAGHSRNGWLLAPVTAEIVSAYVFGGDVEPAWAALSPARFETQ